MARSHSTPTQSHKVGGSRHCLHFTCGRTEAQREGQATCRGAHGPQVLKACDSGVYGFPLLGWEPWGQGPGPIHLWVWQLLWAVSGLVQCQVGNFSLGLRLGAFPPCEALFLCAREDGTVLFLPYVGPSSSVLNSSQSVCLFCLFILFTVSPPGIGLSILAMLAF